jgi:hypothetical protein
MKFVFMRGKYVNENRILGENYFYHKYTYLLYLKICSLNNSIGIVTGYELEGRALIPSRDKRIFFIPQRPDRLWCPLNFLSNGYC